MKHTAQKLYEKLSEYGNVYDSAAEGGANYPYIVYRFIVPSTGFKTQTGDLTIDIWGNSNQSVIELADTIWKGLDNYTYSDVNTSLYVRQSFSNIVPDEDETIFRRQLTFLVLFEEE